jgi:hypothetical protein
MSEYADVAKAFKEHSFYLGPLWNRGLVSKLPFNSHGGKHKSGKGELATKGQCTFDNILQHGRDARNTPSL